MLVLAQNQAQTIDVVLRNPLTEAGALSITLDTGAAMPVPVEAVEVSAAFDSVLVADTVPATGSIVADFQGKPPPYEGSTLTIISDTGRRHTSRVQAVDYSDPANTEILLRTPPVTPFSSGGRVVSNNVKFELIEANTAKRRINYNMRITGVSLSRYVDHTELFAIARRRITNPASAADLLDEWPDAPNTLYNEWVFSQGAEALAMGYQTVVSDLRTRSLDIYLVMDEKPLIRPIVNRVLRRMAKAGLVPAAWVEKVGEWIEILDEDYTDEMRRALGVMSWYDENDSGTVDAETETVGPSYGTTELTR